MAVIMPHYFPVRMNILQISCVLTFDKDSNISSPINYSPIRNTLTCQHDHLIQLYCQYTIIQIGRLQDTKAGKAGKVRCFPFLPIGYYMS